MQTYRATLRPRSATRSPWQADTLFGHLCWLIRYESGEPALRDLLDLYRAGPPPLLFSDGFPGDWLPRPLLPRPSIEAGAEAAKAASVAAMRVAKHEKSIRWISLEEFDALRNGESRVLEARPEIGTGRTVLKNAINRLTGGTTPVDDLPGGGGNLYNADELAFVTAAGTERETLPISIYVRAIDDAWAERAQYWLGQLARSGYGAKKSVGYGHFALEGWEPFPAFDAIPSNANGFISLANWVPAQADPTNGFYETLVKYGKLGEELANSANPFKFPLVMLTAGSCFYTEGAIRAWYGRLVERIAPLPDVPIVHYGYAFAVPAALHPDDQ
jgi:CRISPR-associated protein Csm4